MYVGDALLLRLELTIGSRSSRVTSLVQWRIVCGIIRTLFCIMFSNFYSFVVVFKLLNLQCSMEFLFWTIFSILLIFLFNQRLLNLKLWKTMCLELIFQLLKLTTNLKSSPFLWRGSGAFSSTLLMQNKWTSPGNRNQWSRFPLN